LTHRNDSSTHAAALRFRDSSAVEQSAVDKAEEEVALAKLEKRKYSDRRSYLIEAVHKRRRKVRELAVAYKGGKCEGCGYARCMDALEFHHTDPMQKDFSISAKGYTRSWERVQSELDKCVMLCANCHRELHAEQAARTRNGAVNSG